MIIKNTPEDYQETAIFKQLIIKSTINDGLSEKIVSFINTVKPLQELIIAGPFKNYTLHNSVHSRKLIHLCEYIISKETFQNLSALELCIIIMSCYLHDLGMVLTSTQRERVLTSGDFIGFFQTSKYNDKLLKLYRNKEKVSETEKVKRGYLVYQLYEAALSDFLRPQHATQEKYLELINQIKIDTNRNDIFEVSGMPFENELIEICMSHNLNASVLIESYGLHRERFKRDLVISSQELNVQFCAAVLRLVDILDFDRERTPKSLFNALSISNNNLPGSNISTKEWNKHMSIHTISINKDEVLFSTNCDNPTIEFSIREFCSIIENEVRETVAIVKQNTNEIVQNYYFNIPISVRADIRSIGYNYMNYSIELNESSIINLMMGENLYLNPAVALRELIQNCVDACLVRKIIDKDAFLPKINVCFKKDENSRIWLVVSDNGIGMDDYVLSNYFFKVGNSYYNSIDFKSLIPNYSDNKFIPISRFGIGLLSVFMIGEVIKVTTKNNYSKRKDTKCRELIINGTSSLAFVIEKDSGQQGTTIEVLIREGVDSYSDLLKLLNFVKENVIRPAVPVTINYDDKKIAIVPNNFVQLRNTIKNSLKQYNIEIIQIDLERFSDILRGKAIFIFFLDENGKLNHIDPKGLYEWGKDILKESLLFSNYSGGSRITVNGFQMGLKKIGSLFSVPNQIASNLLDIEVVGIDKIIYDVSRDKIYGKGLHFVRNEIYNSILKGFKELGIYNRFSRATEIHFNFAKRKFTPQEPLDKDLLKKIEALIPKEKWPTGYHKAIASQLSISDKTVSTYINALINQKRIANPNTRIKII